MKFTSKWSLVNVATSAIAVAILSSTPSVAAVHHHAKHHHAKNDHHALHRGHSANVGMASYYRGRGRTASGGHIGIATAAHRSLPFGTRVLVTRLGTGRSVVVTINDRGPFVGGRIIDLSYAAASRIGLIQDGTARVAIAVVGGKGASVRVAENSRF